MDNKKIWTVVGIIIVAVVVILGIYSYTGNQADNDNVQNISTSTEDMIRIDVPLPDVLVQSPLVVRGSARGNWYFEASFPVSVIDSNGKQLGSVAAQAQGDWMTTDFVPFQATLVFATSTTETGTVVFKKDNPSGLPENDASVSIPVYFLNNASKL
jgi:hypothetical protein